MKTTPFLPIISIGLALFSLHASAQEAQESTAPSAPPTESEPSPQPATRGAAGHNSANLRFNFRGAPLETVLNYMSEAAGYIIVLNTPVRGTVDMWSSQPVSKDEA